MPKPSPLLTLLLSTAFLTTASTACLRTRVVVIPADKTVTRLEAGRPFTPAMPGYFVPDARMKEILDRLSEKAVGVTNR